MDDVIDDEIRVLKICMLILFNSIIFNKRLDYKRITEPSQKTVNLSVFSKTRNQSILTDYIIIAKQFSQMIFHFLLIRKT